MTITITAELVPATGLTQISLLRGGITHQARWIDLGVTGDRQDAVLEAARAEIDAAGTKHARITGDEIRDGFYSMTIELGLPDA